MEMRTRPAAVALVSVLGTVAALRLSGCATSRSSLAAANEVYVAPGKWDKYYAFLSGGQSGSVFVVGIPSCRLLREIPVFEPRAAYGYAVNENDERRKLLAATGGLWGDTHHPALSATKGVADGRYRSINDLSN